MGIAPFSIQISDEAVPLAAGSGIKKILTHQDFTPSFVFFDLTTSQASGPPITADIKVNGVSIFSIPPTIDNSANSSDGATVLAALKGDLIPAHSWLSFDVTQVGDGSAMGMFAHLWGTWGDPAPLPAASAGGGGGLVERLVDPSICIQFGNMTALGGIAAAFDGNSNKPATACAAVSGGPGHLGLIFPSPKNISRIEWIGRPDGSYRLCDGGPNTVTGTIWSASSASATPGSGTQLGQDASLNNLAASGTVYGIASTDAADDFPGILVQIDGGEFSTYCAQLRIYELVPA